MQHSESTEDIERTDLEKIRNLYKSLYVDQGFNSFKDLCRYFGIKPPASRNSIKAMETKFSRFFKWNNPKGSYKCIITEVLELELPSVDKNFLSSRYYASCGYLLLKFLATESTYSRNNGTCHITKRGLMRILSICNDNYSQVSNDFLEEAANRNTETKYFIEHIGSHLYKETDRILSSLESRRFIDYDEVWMRVKFNKAIEATVEEAKKIDAYYRILKKEDNLTRKSIRLKKNKNDIYKRLDEYLGFKHFKGLKFYLTANLASYAEYLKGIAQLNENSNIEVNSTMCLDAYNMAYNKIIAIREEEATERGEELAKVQAKAIEQEELDRKFSIAEQLEMFLKDFEINGASLSEPKFKKYYNFNSDDDIVKNILSELIEEFIRKDYTYYEDEE